MIPYGRQDIQQADIDAVLEVLGSAFWPKDHVCKIFRRSVYVTKDIAKSQVLTCDNILSIKFRFGPPPVTLSDLLGKRARRNIKFAEAMDWSMVSGAEG